MTARYGLTQIPDTDLIILDQLSDKDLLAACSTTRYMRDLCEDQKLWKKRILDTFGYLPELPVNLDNYRQWYIWLVSSYNPTIISEYLELDYSSAYIYQSTVEDKLVEGSEEYRSLAYLIPKALSQKQNGLVSYYMNVLLELAEDHFNTKTSASIYLIEYATIIDACLAYNRVDLVKELLSLLRRDYEISVVTPRYVLDVVVILGKYNRRDLLTNSLAQIKEVEAAFNAGRILALQSFSTTNTNIITSMEFIEAVLITKQKKLLDKLVSLHPNPTALARIAAAKAGLILNNYLTATETFTLLTSYNPEIARVYYETNPQKNTIVFSGQVRSSTYDILKWYADTFPEAELIFTTRRQCKDELELKIIPSVYLENNELYWDVIVGGCYDLIDFAFESNLSSRQDLATNLNILTTEHFYYFDLLIYLFPELFSIFGYGIFEDFTEYLEQNDKYITYELYNIIQQAIYIAEGPYGEES